jgi:tRNA-dihydrouridine synthase
VTIAVAHSHSSTVVLESRAPVQPAPRPPLRYGNLQLATRYLLSPLAGFTNLPFRRVCRELGGVGLATTDLISARAIVEGHQKSFQMIETCPVDRPFAVQIFGHDPGVMRDAAQLLEGRGVDSIDINMGCPVDRITRGGAGSAMMCRASDTVVLVQTVVESVRIPVTVKMRLGWDDSQITAPDFAREFEQAGIAAVAIHGRTREQGFRGTVNPHGIRQVVEAWIFRQLDQWERTGTYAPAGTFDDRLNLMLRQFGYLVEQVGPGHALPRFRKMAHWYLKGMRVRPALRHRFQLVRTQEEFAAALEEVREEGPVHGTRDGILTDVQVPVPGGAVERW